MRSLVRAAFVAGAISALAFGGSIFLTGHDADFHAVVGGNAVGAQHTNQRAISYIMDPAFNPFVVGGATKFLFVESSISPIPGGHVDGINGISASGYVNGTAFDKADASTLSSKLNDLGTVYGGLVIASDFGGILTQAELDILIARSPDIIDFLNAGGGLYAMAEGNNGAGLTPNGGWYGFLPFVVTSANLNQGESGYTVTPFGASLGPVNSDVNGNFSHNVFVTTGGMNIVDMDAQGNILSLAVRAQVNEGGVVPEPSTYASLAGGLALLALAARRRQSR
jgi:hypothetical protein